MITNVYLVRHAHSTYTPDELNRPLSDRGQQDARKVADLLKNERIRVLISSPYRRAIQTIEELAGILGADMIIEEDFRERRLSEKPVDDFDSAITKVWEDDSFAWEGGESNRAAQNRGVRALTNVLEQYEGKSVAIGTHGNMMVLIMNHWDNKYDFAFWRQLDMPDIYMLSFDKRRLVEVKRIWDRS